jgi:hypothetical protein
MARIACGPFSRASLLGVFKREALHLVWTTGLGNGLRESRNTNMRPVLEISINAAIMCPRGHARPVT